MMNRVKNIYGQRFGRLIVKSFHEIKNGRAYWLCQCDCGKEKIALGKTLVSGGTTSCGCFQRQRVHEVSFHDITNRRFGYLVADKFVGRRNGSVWQCKCDCGNVTNVLQDKLVSGHTKSCGCLHSYLSKKRAIARNKKMCGKNHPSWRSDLSAEERKRRIEGRFSDPKLNRWRKKVYGRDGYTCKKCNDSRGGNLVAHHIYSWAYYPSLRYVSTNGITLCEKCHKDFHNKFGKKRNTKKQLTQWFKQ